MRKTAVKIVEGESKRISVGARNLEEFVGAPIFQNEKVQRAVGVVTGLATAMGWSHAVHRGLSDPQQESRVQADGTTRRCHA